MAAAVRALVVCTAIATITTAATAQSLQVTNLSREVSAVGAARIGDDVQTDSDAVTAAPDDYGHFDASVHASAAVDAGDDHAGAITSASQSSLVATNRVHASGSAAGSSETHGLGTFAETDSFSNFLVGFALDEPLYVALAGDLISNDFGQANLRLSGPSGTIVEFYVQGAGIWTEVDELLELQPGTYFLWLEAFADSEAQNDNLDYQGGSFDITLELHACNDPDPVTYENVPLGVSTATNVLHRNLNPDGGTDWDAVGNCCAARGIAVHPNTGVVYVVAGTGLFQTLLTVDPDTGQTLTSVPIILANPFDDSGIWDIAFDRDGTLYGTHGVQAIGWLVEIDPATGIVTFTDLLLFPDPQYGVAITFAPGTRILYATTGPSEILLWLNLDTQDGDQIILPNMEQMTALAFHPSGDPFIVATIAAQILEVDLASQTFAPAFDAPPPSAYLEGLAYAPEVVADPPLTCTPVDGDPGDGNRDGVIDVADLNLFAGCMTGPDHSVATPACLHFDVDHDGDSDLADMAAVMRLLGE
jgi:hypothetical protein